jgi:hypothetical protein
LFRRKFQHFVEFRVHKDLHDPASAGSHHHAHTAGWSAGSALSTAGSTLSIVGLLSQSVEGQRKNGNGECCNPQYVFHCVGLLVIKGKVSINVPNTAGVVKFREIFNALHKAGFEEVSQRRSQRKLKKQFQSGSNSHCTDVP